MYIDELYKCAGQWYIHNGDIILGLKYLLKAKQHNSIFAELEKSSINIVIDNNLRYITIIPADFR